MQRRARARTGRPGATRSGFTLIELLTVIAIIAILVALLFPVFATVRRQMNQSSCMSNLHQIVQALQMYKDDHHVYPECLYDFIDTDPNNPWKGQIQHRLYPNYVKDLTVFHCPNGPIPLTKDDQLGGANKPTVQATNMMLGQPATYLYYPGDNYDFGFRPYASVTTANYTQALAERHYDTFWQKGLVAPGPGADGRQLIFKTPPDSTVVTWCLNHADMDDNGNPSTSSMAVVAFLSGRVQTIPASKLVAWNNCSSTATCPWEVSPKP